MLAVSASALAACSSSTKGVASNATGVSSTSTSASSSASSSSAAPTTTAPTITDVAVHVSVNIADGASLGVGMPYIATFDKKITDGRAFQKATKVTVNGQAVDAHWYFEYSTPTSGHLMEAHLRTEDYWPANAQIHVDLPVKGLSGGTPSDHPLERFVFDQSLTSDWTTTDAHIVTVTNATHTLTVTDNGKQWGSFPVSLGAPQTPTLSGTKVIMDKGRDVEMKGPGYDDPHVKWTQRLTYGGEYLHAAPWNCAPSPALGCTGPQNNIGSADSSNGCTNLRPADAEKLYNFLGIGDVVLFPDATGARMQLGLGYGDWNVTWTVWKTGGAIKTQ
jgi:lipoprotein-anchoring transpeptidase ErfK/SrfK